jgi:Fe-S cluster biosynthesis and repair protein YggX
VAKSYVTVAKTRPRYFEIGQEAWSLWLNGRKISYKMGHTIYNHINAPALLTYWKRKQGAWEEGIDNNLNW